MVAGEGEEGRTHGFGLFVFGLLLGIAGTIVLPRLVGPHMPGVLRLGGAVMEGRVLAKMEDANRLLLKIQFSDDVYLATFEERQREIDLLVDEGDLVTLKVHGNRPFPMSPEIQRVRKDGMEETSPTSTRFPDESTHIGMPTKPSRPPGAEESPPSVHAGDTLDAMADSTAASDSSAGAP